MSISKDVIPHDTVVTTQGDPMEKIKKVFSSSVDEITTILNAALRHSNEHVAHLYMLLAAIWTQQCQLHRPTECASLAPHSIQTAVQATMEKAGHYETFGDLLCLTLKRPLKRPLHVRITQTLTFTGMLLHACPILGSHLHKLAAAQHSPVTFIKSSVSNWILLARPNIQDLMCDGNVDDKEYSLTDWTAQAVLDTLQRKASSKLQGNTAQNTIEENKTDVPPAPVPDNRQPRARIARMLPNVGPPSTGSYRKEKRKASMTLTEVR
jgi:hypothetical protein